MKLISIGARLIVAVIGLLNVPALAMAQIKLPEEVRIRPNRLAKIEAVCDTPVKWLNLHDDIDLIPDSSGRFATVLGVRPGRYKIAAYTASKDGVPSEPAYCIIVVEGTVPPPPPDKPAPPTPGNVEGAIVKLRFGSAGCTATIMGPRRTDGRWDVLTAAHCTGAVGARGEITLQDGKRVPVTVVVRNTSADISWMIADLNEPLTTFAMLAKELPGIGTTVWHKGYGVHMPGNLEEGTVASTQDANGQIRMVLSVSSGDSGTGIFRKDDNRLVAVVCCTASMAKKGNMWGGSSVKAGQLRPANTDAIDPEEPERPVQMPIRDDEEAPTILPFMQYAAGKPHRR